MPILYETVDYDGACKRLGCSRSTVARLAKEKKIPSFVIAGKRRFPTQGLDDYVNKLVEDSMKTVRL